MAARPVPAGATLPAPRLTGLLLVLAAAVLAAAAVPGVPSLVETIGFALVGGAVVAVADAAVSPRRFGAVTLDLIAVGVADRLAELAVSVGHSWGVAAAAGTYLLWRSSTSAPSAVLVRTVPAVAAVAIALALRGSVGDIVLTAALTAAAGVAAAVAAVPRARTLATRARLARNQADVDAVVMANLELRSVADADEAARRVARLATELLDADGAVVWLQGFSRLLCAGGHGVTPPPDRRIPPGSVLDRVLETGHVLRAGDEVVLPISASGGVFGAVTVNGARRSDTSFVGSILQVFGAQAGYALERLRAVEGLIDARYVDPVTGVGNRAAATASLAHMRPGDAVLLLAVDDLERIRTTEGDARADLVLGQLGLHLRTATRAGDLVARFGDDQFFVMLRDLDANAELVVSRLMASWGTAGTAGPLRAGAAVHLSGRSPLDTLDRAAEALEAARLDVRPPIAVATERAAWGRTA